MIDREAEVEKWVQAEPDEEESERDGIRDYPVPTQED